MDYQEAVRIIQDKTACHNKTFLVTSNGNTQKERLFVSSDGSVCRFQARSRRRGYALPPQTVASWTALCPYEENDTEQRMIQKFIRYASKATFPSAFVRKCLNADITKGCYENRLTTGCCVDGQVITLKCIERYAPCEVAAFRKALHSRTPYHSCRFPFQGYEGSLWLEIADHDDDYNKTGDVRAGFSKEFKGCLNGYYYALINDEAFIGVDKD